MASEAVVPFRSNFLPWLEQVAGVSPDAIRITEELPDRLFFEDPKRAVLNAFLMATRKPIISQPDNHGSWVPLSVRWAATPSCQLIVCRRLVSGTTDQYEDFYGVDFDFAPWTTKRPDWMAKHTLEVARNAITKSLTDQAEVRRRLQESGVVFG